MTRRRLRNSSGFTLVELLVAGTVLAIITSFFLSSLSIQKRNYTINDQVIELALAARAGLRTAGMERAAARGGDRIWHFARDRHAGHYAELGRDAFTRANLAGASAYLLALAQDIDNIVAATNHARATGDLETAALAKSNSNLEAKISLYS